MHFLVYHLPDVEVRLLRPDELDAVERAAYAVRGEDYLRERSLLRRELERRTGVAAAQLQFSYGDLGKPECSLQPFNLSHSGDYLCIAFHHRAVGVDIERIRPRRRIAPIARRIMCFRQFEAWKERGSCLEEFYACWCAAEALAKWRGSSVLRAIDLPFVYREGSIEPCFESAPVVELFTPASGYVGAVACCP